MSEELQIEEITPADGAQPQTGDSVSVHYTGWLTDGTKFDSQVIQGWDQGVATMKVGQKVKLTIPSHMGYGAKGAGGVIPPNATLVFEVELLDIN